MAERNVQIQRQSCPACGKYLHGYSTRDCEHWNCACKASGDVYWTGTPGTSTIRFITWDQWKEAI